MDAARSETLTFLLSDIEGSTRRWERDDGAMAAAVERHDEIVDECVTSHDGVWVKHTGDGALVAFPSAHAALGAAVQFQRAMTREDWERVGGLRVRMALHTGEVIRRDGDYFGQMLNRASRVLDAAHGGQILVTLATEELVRDGLPDGVTLRDLGAHVFGDLSRPERVFQVDIGGLPSEFPPPRGVVDVPRRLPNFRTSFVGREGDLSVVVEALDTSPLVTLTGVGGSGKTRLAVEVAHRLVDRFPDGLFFVDLAAITDEALVPRQSARAVGLVTGGFMGASSRPIRDQLLHAIQDRRMLIVVDNCEHLLDASAEHIEDLLRASAELRVLATSREALAVEGEQVVPVTSLALPEDGTDEAASMRLLLDRVGELRPDFEVNAEGREHLVEICRRLDGLPLALELAAARLEHLSPADLASRLDDRFRLLSGARRRIERQQTLRAAIDWSYDLLDGTEQIVLRRLSVFAGGAGLDAIQGVTTVGLEDVEAIDVLGRLVSRSLVVADTAGESRYRLLETIRLYGEDKLVQAGEAEEIRARHRDWFLAWLESFPWDLRLFSPVVATQVHAEYDNLRLALEWSASQDQSDMVARLTIALTGFGIFNGFGEELDRWIAVAREGELDAYLATVLDAHEASLDLWQYDGDPSSFDRVRAVSDRVFELLPAGDPVRAFARLCYAVSYSTRPNEPWHLEQAAAEAAELAAAADSPWIQMAAMSFQANARLYHDDPAGAAAIIRSAMELPEWAPEHDGYNLRHVLAVALHLLGEQDEALAYALSVANESSVTWRHMGLFDAAAISAAKGETQESRRYVRRGLEHLESSRWQHPMSLTDCTVLLATIAACEERWEDAARLLAISGGNVSHPSLFAIWKHYRDRVRGILPKDARRRCIEEGSQLDPKQAIEHELALP